MPAEKLYSLLFNNLQSIPYTYFNKYLFIDI